MLTRWLTFTAFLAGSANPERAALGQGSVTVTPTCRIKGHPEVELTLNCGDGKKAGVVEYWHTPFGDFHTPSFHNKLDPVFMHHDGSLVIPNTSRLHGGFYYCLQQHTEGTTLWPYELHVGPDDQKNQEHGGYEEGSSCDALRFRRDVGSEEEEQGGVSDEQFAAAVAASVLLTFVLGFSAGALSRTHVLRCLGTVAKRLQSPRRQQCQTDMSDHGDDVTMTTLPSMYDNQAFQLEPVRDDDSAHRVTTETMISSVTSSPPAKPQRSFRHKREEERETTAYLEGGDHMKEEEKRLEVEEEEEKNKGCDGEAEEEEGGFYLLEEDRGSETETDEDKCSDDGEEKDGRKENREEKKEWRREEEVEEAGEQVNRSNENEEERRSSEEEAATGNKEKRRDEKMREEGWRGEEEEGGDDGEKKRSEEDEETDISRDDEAGRKNQEDTMKNGIKGGGGGGEPSSSLPRPGRRSRVIRLYQYNEDGQRYCHLPDPAPSDTGPAPRLKQRTLSLTRLNAIMAAASAGPLDASQNKRETEGEEREERPHFHMEI
ncbi:trichohyalin isoform X2 [Thunnus maccoyii]|nr:trichohyalin isoform X2 [Thunnus maccoyii]